MPMQRELYPPNWNEIARAVKDRAGWQCQQCAAAHDSCIVRDKQGRWSLAPEGAVKPTRVMITVHHIGVDHADGTPGSPRDKMDCRDENLIALCQRCHLLADMDHHIANRKANRARKQREQARAAGQKKLWEAER